MVLRPSQFLVWIAKAGAFSQPPVDIRLGRRRRFAAILNAPLGEMSFHFMASARMAVVQNFLVLALPGNSFSGILRPASHNLL
jgi:hypothetical protein